MPYNPCHIYIKDLELYKIEFLTTTYLQTLMKYNQSCCPVSEFLQYPTGTTVRWHHLQVRPKSLISYFFIVFFLLLFLLCWWPLGQDEGLHDKSTAHGAVLESGHAAVAHTRVTAGQQHAVQGCVLAHHAVLPLHLQPLVFQLRILLRFLSGSLGLCLGTFSSAGG